MNKIFLISQLLEKKENLTISKLTGWPKKKSLFFFGNDFYKNKETFKILSPQILKVYRILLVQTTLESIIFYYTFLVINDMFDPSTALNSKQLEH